MHILMSLIQDELKNGHAKMVKQAKDSIIYYLAIDSQGILIEMLMFLKH